MEECLCLGVSCVSCLPGNQESFILDLGGFLPLPALLKASLPLLPATPKHAAQWAGFM